MMTDKLQKVRKYFEEEENIILAFVFGSRAKGFGGKNSDLDIGIYLKDKNDEERIWLNISKITGQEVDLIFLDDAPATLISSIFKTGIPVVIKDRKLYWDIYLTKTLEAEDFYEFVESYWKIYSRSKSLVPEDKIRLIERMQFLKSELEEIEGFKNLAYREYCEDKVKRRNIERWAENIINATIDIAKIILAAEKREIPKTYEQALLNFGFFVGLKEKEAARLASFAWLRNILAHEYLDIIYNRIKKFIIESPFLYKKIFVFLSKKTK